MLAIQAQDFPGAKWALGLRAPGTTLADVDAALAAGTIVRSWPMRGTLHLTPAEDLKWMLALMTPRVLAGLTKRQTELQLDAKALAKARRRRAQGARRHAPRSPGHVRGARQGEAERRSAPRLPHAVLSRADRRGLHGPGRQLRPRRRVDQDLARARPRSGARRARGALLPLARARRPSRISSAGASSPPATRSSAPSSPRRSSRSTRTTTSTRRRSRSRRRPRCSHCPGFDELILGYEDRTCTLPEKFAERIVPGGNGMFISTVVANGVAVGTWARAQKPKQIVDHGEAVRAVAGRRGERLCPRGSRVRRVRRQAGHASPDAEKNRPRDHSLGRPAILDARAHHPLRRSVGSRITSASR